MRAIADYLAAKQPELGLGLYTDHGNGSCGHGPVIPGLREIGIYQGSTGVMVRSLRPAPHL